MGDRVPLWQQTASPEFRTPRIDWKPSDQEIRERVALAAARASRAGILACRNGTSIGEVLLLVRKEFGNG